MVEMARVAPETETPVNPYSLLEAVNNSSDTVNTGWLIFLAIMTYLMIAVAGVTHQDLLLQTPVSLPILQVQIQLKQFFQFAPVILVLFHIGVIAQLVLLARKTIEFDLAIRLLETTSRRTHPLRLELHNFFFVQAIAGPHRSRVMSSFLHGMSWLTLVILPVVLLLYIQVVFLPYHDVATTWMHRIAIVADIAVLLLIGVFLLRVETSFLQAFWRTTASHPFSSVTTTALLIVIAVLSFFAATIPGEPLDRLVQALFGGRALFERPGEKRAEGGFAVPLLGMATDGSFLFLFRRNLVVTDADLVDDKSVGPNEKSVNLRGRDLRFAKLDRSDLHQADMTDVNLDEASLVGTDLRSAYLQCADPNQLQFGNRADGGCASARHANFSKAHLQDAHMDGIDLTGATLDGARLDAAELNRAVAVGTDFSGARLDQADATSLDGQDANFLVASLQGTDLTGARLQVADFGNASLRGAVLKHASLEGAKLADTDLTAASLQDATLYGADLARAATGGTDFRGAKIWLTPPPQADPATLTDFTYLAVGPLSEADVGRITATIDGLERRSAKGQLRRALTHLTDEAKAVDWVNSTEHQKWQEWAAGAEASTGSDDYKVRLTDFLGREMCKTRWGSGTIATGVARRAIVPYFRADAVALHDRMKTADCPGGKAVPARVLRDLSALTDQLRSN